MYMQLCESCLPPTPAGQEDPPRTRLMMTLVDVASSCSHRRRRCRTSAVLSYGQQSQEKTPPTQVRISEMTYRNTQTCSLLQVTVTPSEVHWIHLPVGPSGYGEPADKWWPLSC